MPGKNEWWKRVDRRWHKVRYSDYVDRFFWDRSVGFFFLTVEKVERGQYKIGVTRTDGSIDAHHEELFKGSEQAAKCKAVKLAEDIISVTLEALGVGVFSVHNYPRFP